MNNNTLKFITVVNPLKAQGKSKYDYVGQFVSNGTVELDAFCDKLVKQRPNLDRADALLVINTLFAVIRDEIAEYNCRFSLGDIVFESAIAGSLPSMDSALTAENPLYVSILIGDALRRKVAALEPTRDTSEAVKVTIFGVEDAATHEPGVIHGTATAIVSGKNLSATLEGESIVLADLVTGATVSTGTVVAVDGCGQRLDVNFAAPFAAGSYWLVLTTRGYSTPDAEPESYSKKVKATEAIAPTVTSVTKVTQAGRAENDLVLSRSTETVIHGTLLNLDTAGGDKVRIELYKEDGTTLHDYGDCTSKITANTADAITLSGLEWENEGGPDGDWYEVYPRSKVVVIKGGVRYVFPLTFKGV